jgi:hypothetical protein
MIGEENSPRNSKKRADHRRIVMAKKASKIDWTCIQTLKDLMAELETKITSCQTALDTAFSWAGLQRTAEDIYELASAIKEKLPEKGTKTPAGLLCQHAYFMKKYAYEKDRDFIDSNLRSLKIDYRNVRERINSLDQETTGRYTEIAEEITAVRDSDAKSYLNESSQCLLTGAYRASAVMSGCSLELLVRSIYKQAKGHDSSRLSFARVVEGLEEDRQLSSDQAAIVSICRVFRNLTGHPSGFKCTREEAESLLRLAVAQLKKSQG